MREKGDNFHSNEHFFHSKLGLRDKLSICHFVIWVKNIYIFSQKWRFESWALSQSKKQKCLSIVCSILLLVQNGLFTLFLGCWEEQRGLVHSGRHCFNLFQISIMLNTETEGCQIIQKQKKNHSKSIKNKEKLILLKSDWMVDQAMYIFYIFQKNSDIKTPLSTSK